MKKYFLQAQTFTILTILVFVTSCSGQVKTGLPKDSISETKLSTSGHPKLTKTQGTDQYVSTRCGLQDKEGNLWFGTTGEGVYRYDGKSFIQFTVKEGLSSNIVWSILEDKAGNIWFGTDDGLSRYDGKTVTKIPITRTIGSNFFTNNTSNNNISVKNAVWSMLQDKSGKLWFGTSEGMYCYNGIFFTRFLDDYSIVNDNNLHLKMVDCMLEDKNGNIWFASGMPPGMEGLCRYDGKSIIRFNPGGDEWIRYILEDKAGNIWSGGRHYGTWYYDGTVFTRFMEDRNIGHAVLEDKAGNLWFDGSEHPNGYGGNGGIWRYDGQSFTNFTTKDGLGDYYAWCMVEDRNGNIWVGTRNTGLYRYDGTSFTSFSE